MEQGSEEWLALRRGKFTASEVYRLMGIKGLGETGETYIMEKVTEELGGTIPSIETAPMEYGTLTEPFARAHFEKAMGMTVELRPFFVAEWCGEAGYSPDGIIVETKQLIEIKCPYNPLNHIKHMMISDVQELKKQKPMYYWQMQMGMAVTGYVSCYFISYCTQFDAELKMMVMEVMQNEEDINLLKSRVLQAVIMKREIVEKIKRLRA